MKFMQSTMVLSSIHTRVMLECESILSIGI